MDTGVSTGNVLVEDAGLTFREKISHSYVRTNADCIVTTGE